MKRIGIPLVALGLLACANAALAQPGVQDFLVDLNRTALGAYHQGRQTQLDRTSPIVLVAFDELVLRREGVETRERSGSTSSCSGPRRRDPGTCSSSTSPTRSAATPSTRG